MKKIIFILISTTLLLSACSNNISSGATTTNIPSAESSPSSVVDNSDVSATAYNAEAIKEEASMAWDAFLEVVSVMETDPAYSTIIKVYENTVTVYSQHYQTVTGKDAQEYIDLTSFEKFLWY